MKIRNLITGLIGTPPVNPTAHEPIEEGPFSLQIPTDTESNRGTVATGIRVGDAHFCYFEETKDFHTLALYYSNDVMLTPGYMNACALYQAIKLGVIERHDDLIGREFEKRVRAVGADWSFLRTLEVGGKRKLWICQGPLTLHADPIRLTQLFSDLTAAIQKAGLDPERYFALPH